MEEDYGSVLIVCYFFVNFGIFKFVNNNKILFLVIFKIIICFIFMIMFVKMLKNYINKFDRYV